MLNEAELPFIASKNEKEMSKNTFKMNFDPATAALKNLIDQKALCTQNGTSSRGRIRASTARAIDENALDLLNIQIIEAKQTLRQEKASLSEVNRELDRSIRDYDAWKSKFPNRNQDTLLNYCRELAKPVLAYYSKLFLDEDGDNYHMRKAAFSCQLFDPMFLEGKQNDLHRLFYLADQLIHFRYPQFTQEFIALLKQEIPLAVNHSNMYFDWSSIKETSQFRTRMQRRIKRHNLDAAKCWEVAR
jgi:hypothetical protein